MKEAEVKKNAHADVTKTQLEEIVDTGVIVFSKQMKDLFISPIEEGLILRFKFSVKLGPAYYIKHGLLDPTED